MTMKFEGRKGLDEAMLAILENLVGFRLPPDYRLFLRRSDGGSFIGGYPEFSQGTIGTICCDSLFGMSMPQSLNLEFWYKEMTNEIPRDSLLIGKDPSGGFFLLCCDPEFSGVYYYDHCYHFPTSNDAENTYLITENFGQFARFIGINMA